MIESMIEIKGKGKVGLKYKVLDFIIKKIFSGLVWPNCIPTVKPIRIFRHAKMKKPLSPFYSPNFS